MISEQAYRGWKKGRIGQSPYFHREDRRTRAQTNRLSARQWNRRHQPATRPYPRTLQERWQFRSMPDALRQVLHMAS